MEPDVNRELREKTFNFGFAIGVIGVFLIISMVIELYLTSGVTSASKNLWKATEVMILLFWEGVLLTIVGVWICIKNRPIAKTSRQ